MALDAKGRSETGYRMHVFVCGHERPEGSARGCCMEKGSLDLMRELKMMAKDAGIDDVRVQKSGCLDFCENGPSCVIYPQGEWYKLSEQSLPSFLDYLKGGNAPIEHKMRLE
jgi:(2Fe-2S) ferredoxin